MPPISTGFASARRPRPPERGRAVEDRSLARDALAAAPAGPGLRQRLSALVYRSLPYRLSLGSAKAHALTLVPADPWPGDADRGAALMAGAYALAGRFVQSEMPPWKGADQGTAFRRELHGFAWLRDLRAVGGDAARRHARLLVEHWLDHHGQWDRLSWRADVLGQRVMNWLAAHDFFLASADDRFRRRVLAALARQTRHLARVAPGNADGAQQVEALRGLIAGVLAVPGAAPALPRALRLLDRAIARQILPDGGHGTRNPSTHLSVLLALIDIRSILRQAGETPPESVQQAVDRMTPALRFFKHGDGRLALFNGAQEGVAVLVDAALARADARGRPMKSARHSGFERILAGRTLVLMDVGAPPPPGLNRAAHAGPLSFELSVGRERLIVNCGAVPEAGSGPVGDWHGVLRGTAAHSALVVADTNAIGVLDDGGMADRAVTVEAERLAEQGAVLIDARHDGYRARFGLVHRRRLYISAGGDDIRGEDTLTAEATLPRPPVHPFAIRFHLHPNVRASLTQDGTAILLRLSGGAGFRFLAGNAGLALEDSIYFGNGMLRRTQQIVLTGQTDGDATGVQWSLKREVKG